MSDLIQKCECDGCNTPGLEHNGLYGLPELPEPFGMYAGVRLDQEGEVLMEVIVDPGPGFGRWQDHSEKTTLFTRGQMQDFARAAMANQLLTTG